MESKWLTRENPAINNISVFLWVLIITPIIVLPAELLMMIYFLFILQRLFIDNNVGNMTFIGILWKVEF